jgi:hypothetical protein
MQQLIRPFLTDVAASVQVTKLVRQLTAIREAFTSDDQPSPLLLRAA